MARKSILSDELLRQLMAVGQVDILVGVPTLNHAATIQSVIKTLHIGLAKHFPRERTVIVNVDGGSDDGTMDLVRTAPMADEELRGSTTLRTTHRVSVTHPGLPGQAGGERLVFAAADLLQARAVLLVDADLTNLAPGWVAELARPVWTDEADVVLPIHPRGPYEGPLLNQLVRPLLGTSFARRLHSRVAGDIACSGRFAARLVPGDVWERSVTRPGLDVWLVAQALAEDLRLQQVHLGPRTLHARPARSSLPELFQHVVGMAFAALSQHAPRWLARTEPAEIPTRGTPWPAPEDGPHPDPGPLAERFRSGVRDLAPLLGEFLQPGTLGRLLTAAAPGDQPVRVTDDLWVTLVYEFAAASHRGLVHQDHATQVLVPLYLGRIASYFAEIEALDEDGRARRLMTLEQEYERLRPYLVERWSDERGR